MARQIEGARTPNTSARAALVPAIVLLLVAACSASAETLTVDEYIAWCGGMDSTEEDLLTWGDWAKALEPVLDEARAISPPGELRDFHTASLEGIQIIVDLVEAKPADDEANIPELVDMVTLANGLIATAAGKLPDDLRSSLDDVGCSTG